MTSQLRVIGAVMSGWYCSCFTPPLLEQLSDSKYWRNMPEGGRRRQCVLVCVSLYWGEHTFELFLEFKPHTKDMLFLFKKKKKTRTGDKAPFSLPVKEQRGVSLTHTRIHVCFCEKSSLTNSPPSSLMPSVLYLHHYPFYVGTKLVAPMLEE